MNFIIEANVFLGAISQKYIPNSPFDIIYLGRCAVWLKSDLSLILNMNKEELSQT